MWQNKIGLLDTRVVLNMQLYYTRAHTYVKYRHLKYMAAYPR